MTGAVGHECDEVIRMSLRVTEKPVDGADYDTDQIDILPFVEAPYIIGVGNASVVEYSIDRAGMVLDVEPVAHVLSLAIYWQRFAMADIIDEEWYEFFGELIRSVVVRAVGHERRHPVCVVIGADKMIG